MKPALKHGIFLAILAAALYALNSPFSKLLLAYMPSTLMAGFLYAGAGLGMIAINFFGKSTCRLHHAAVSGNSVPASFVNEK